MMTRDSEWVGISEVVALTGVGRVSVARLYEAGRFPVPVNITGRRGRCWRRTEVESWARANTFRFRREKRTEVTRPPPYTHLSDLRCGAKVGAVACGAPVRSYRTLMLPRPELPSCPECEDVFLDDLEASLKRGTSRKTSLSVHRVDADRSARP